MGPAAAALPAVATTFKAALPIIKGVGTVASVASTANSLRNGGQPAPAAPPPMQPPPPATQQVQPASAQDVSRMQYEQKIAEPTGGEVFTSGLVGVSGTDPEADLKRQYGLLGRF